MRRVELPEGHRNQFLHVQCDAEPILCAGWLLESPGRMQLAFDHGTWIVFHQENAKPVYSMYNNAWFTAYLAAHDEATRADRG